MALNGHIYTCMIKNINVRAAIFVFDDFICYDEWYETLMPWSRTCVLVLQLNVSILRQLTNKMAHYGNLSLHGKNIKRRPVIVGFHVLIWYASWFEMLMPWSGSDLFVLQSFMGSFEQSASKVALHGHTDLHGQKHYFWGLYFLFHMALYAMMSDIKHSYHHQGYLRLHCSKIYHYETVG